MMVSVRAETDAAILLTGGDMEDGYEIIIGGWNNSQSVIRDSKQNPMPGHAVTKVVFIHFPENII